MLSLILQVVGGIFFLGQKILLAVAERQERVDPSNRSWRIWSWVLYLIGLPAWVAIFILERNWIAAALEASGAPAMVLGLIIAIRGKGEAPKWLDAFSIIGIVCGVSYSLYDFGGFNTLRQWLEAFMAVGFLIGTYRLAKKHNDGYLWYLLMCAACCGLMFIQKYYGLTAQQVVSLGFIVYGYILARRKTKNLQPPHHDPAAS